MFPCKIEDFALHLPRACLEALSSAKPEVLERLFPGGRIDIKDGFACLSLDAMNAFNQFYIDSVLESVVKRAPQLVGFFNVCYRPGGSAKVVLDDRETCISVTSLFQGCAISSIACACVILDILEEVRAYLASTSAGEVPAADGSKKRGKMTGWSIETAFQDVFAVVPVKLVPAYLELIRFYGARKGLSFDNVAKNMCYLPRQYLRGVGDVKQHLEKLWRYRSVEAHIIEDEAVGGVARGVKALKQEQKLKDNSIVVSTVGFERVMGVPFRLVEEEAAGTERAVSIAWLIAHVRAAAQDTFHGFAHLGSPHVDDVARSIVTEPESFVASEDGLPSFKNHAQLSSLVVKYSLASKLRHLARALPREVVEDVLMDVERLTVAAYESLLGQDLRFDQV